MIFTTAELLNLYKGYKNPKMKIQHEYKKGNLLKVNRGLYETNRDVAPFLLAGYIKSPSYLSFEYALSLYGLIPESVYTYTSATCSERHTFEYINKFGRYVFRDIPKNVFPLEIHHFEEGRYSYNIASREKALCDFLAIKKPIKNAKLFYSYLFDSLRIDEDEFKSLDFVKLIDLASLYKRKNLKLLASILTQQKYLKLLRK